MIRFKTPPNSLRIRHRQIQIQIQQRLLCFSEKPLLFFSLPLPKSQNVTKICQGQSKCMKNCLSETTFIVKITAHPQNRNYSQLHCQSLLIIRKLPAKKELVVYRRSKISVVLAFRKTVERKYSE